MNQLETLKNLGVTTLSVTNDLATAVNPYPEKSQLVDYNGDARGFTKNAAHQIFIDSNLPPLPTSGIPDGTVGIDEVYYQLQTFDKDGVLLSTELTQDTIEQRKLSHPENDYKYIIRYKQQEEYRRFNDDVDITDRFIARVEQQVEVKPEGLLHPFIQEALSYSYQSESSLPQPEQPEQTAEGIYMKVQRRGDPKYILRPQDWEVKAMEEYASLHLSQYKASLIEKLKELPKKHYLEYKEVAGIQEAINLIKNS